MFHGTFDRDIQGSACDWDRSNRRASNDSNEKRFKGKSNGFRGRRDSTRVAFFLTNKFLREKASTYDVKRIDDSSNVFEINE